MCWIREFDFSLLLSCPPVQHFGSTLFNKDLAGYEDGAPTSTCLTRYPKHGASAQTTSSPYTIKFDKQSYNPSDQIKVTVSGTKIKGIQMAAFRADDLSEEVLGQFSNMDAKLKAFTCFGEMPDNMITHSHDHSVQSVTVTWTAPSANVGHIVFKTTIVRDYSEFWVDIKTQLNSSNPASAVGVKYPKISTTSLVQDIDFSGCGNTKGCFLYPSSCSGDDCIAAATFEHLQSADEYSIELTTKYDSVDYVALGLSDDRHMGDDETITCVVQGTKLNVQHSYNPGYFNDRKLTTSLSNVQVKNADGRIQCRFTLPKITDIYLITQGAKSFQYTNTSFDHGKTYYLQIAWGSVMTGSDVIAQHEIMPPVTFDKLSLSDKSIFRGSAYGILVHAHVSLMLVAWLFITGVTTVSSRHYKNWLPEKKILGTKVWFQVHRGLAFLVILLTALGLVMVFTEYGAEIREGSIPHSILGLIVTGFIGLQIIMGMLRPGPDHKRRIIFNWGHRVLGQLTHITAAVTMFLGFGMDQTVQDMKTFGLAVVAVWLVGQIVWHVIFEVLSRPGWPLNVTDDQGDTEKSKKKKSSKLLTILLVIYTLFLVALCVAAMAAFLIY
ncbi:putative ferric-chelate reductase 1 isoform X2 [Biomphalaria glabrata]|uniref:Ferric-chelate reductase 1 isoform X2 n=1 Tax=Biomphalaria glabrata TaxID=6526 RepID=A0A9W2YNH7_BIOGL|nr:putative ferric-chelate reductase 1 isoform X2 [Biomphalaria glabrata]